MKKIKSFLQPTCLNTALQVTNGGARPVLVSGEARLLTANELYKHVVLTDRLILIGRKAVC